MSFLVSLAHVVGLVVLVCLVVSLFVALYANVFWYKVESLNKAKYGSFTRKKYATQMVVNFWDWLTNLFVLFFIALFLSLKGERLTMKEIFSAFPFDKAYNFDNDWAEEERKEKKGK